MRTRLLIGALLVLAVVLSAGCIQIVDTVRGTRVTVWTSPGEAGTPSGASWGLQLKSDEARFWNAGSLSQGFMTFEAGTAPNSSGTWVDWWSTVGNKAIYSYMGDAWDYRNPLTGGVNIADAHMSITRDLKTNRCEATLTVGNERFECKGVATGQ